MGGLAQTAMFQGHRSSRSSLDTFLKVSFSIVWSALAMCAFMQMYSGQTSAFREHVQIHINQMLQAGFLPVGTYSFIQRSSTTCCVCLLQANVFNMALTAVHRRGSCVYCDEQTVCGSQWKPAELYKARNQTSPLSCHTVKEIYLKCCTHSRSNSECFVDVRLQTRTYFPVRQSDRCNEPIGNLVLLVLFLCE